MNTFKPADDEDSNPPSRGSLVVTNKSLALPVISLKGVVSAPSAALNKFHDVTDSLSMSPTTVFNAAAMVLIVTTLAAVIDFFFSGTDDTVGYWGALLLAVELLCYVVAQGVFSTTEKYRVSDISTRSVIIWCYLALSLFVDVCGVCSVSKLYGHDWTYGNWYLLLGGIGTTAVVGIMYGLYATAKGSKDVKTIFRKQNERRGSFRKAMGFVMFVSMSLLLRNIYFGFVPHLDEGRAGYALVCLALSMVGFIAIYYIFDDSVSIEKDRGVEILGIEQR